jgi:hypothetical protein
VPDKDTAAQAQVVAEFLDDMHDALSCVTFDAHFDVGAGFHATPRPHALILDPGQAPLRVDPGISLRALQFYVIVQDAGCEAGWRVSTWNYLYSLHDAEGQEILSYQWDPRARGSPVSYPHLHISPAAQAARPEFAKAHLPTGRVAFEDVIRLAIEGFEVEPAREDWHNVLKRTKERWIAQQTWGMVV